MTERNPLPTPPAGKDHEGKEFPPIYTATVTVHGGVASHGRASGRARSSDGALELDLRMPAELGGDGRGTNPEQLFAAALAACFHGTLSLLARREALDPAALSVAATVALRRDLVDGGYALRTDLVVRWTGVAPEKATGLIEKAGMSCPYARMVRKSTPTTVTLAP